MDREYIRSAHVLSLRTLDLQPAPVIGEQETAKMGLPRGVQLLSGGITNGGTAAAIRDGWRRADPAAARILRIADTYARLPREGRFGRPGPLKMRKKILIEWQASNSIRPS